MENDVEEALQVELMGTSEFDPPDFCRRLGMDAFGYHYPKGVGVTAGQRLQSTAAFSTSYHEPTKITFDFVPPWIAEMGTDEETGRSYVARGLLTSPESLALFDRYLPDPDHPTRYERVAEWVARYKQEFAVFARLRLGAASTIVSMPMEDLSFAIYDNPKLLHEIHSRFSEWSARVVEHLNGMDFDFLWVNDDLAANQGPLVSPQVFREFFLPHMREVARTIKKPWVFHSDGDIKPLLDDLLTLGMSAIHPIQPAAMDLGEIKREYGERVCLVGNIDLDYTLTLGTPEEVDAEVRERIAAAAPGGGYILSSANSLPDYCKVENVWAMAAAVKKYGAYPLKV
jgi:uroporphyrinogen-III decarboxylase